MTRALLFTLLLAGCATVASPRATTVLCPVAPVAYSLDDEHALKVEYDALGGSSQVRRWIKDYIAERASLRACARS